MPHGISQKPVQMNSTTFGSKISRVNKVSVRCTAAAPDNKKPRVRQNEMLEETKFERNNSLATVALLCNMNIE